MPFSLSFLKILSFYREISDRVINLTLTKCIKDEKGPYTAYVALNWMSPDDKLKKGRSKVTW